MGHDRDHEHEHGRDRDVGRGMRGGRGRFGDSRGERGGWGAGRRMRSGDIRRAILSALRYTPAHGYEVKRRLEETSGGLWRPSPGSIYPHLQLLEGMVHSTEHDGTRNFTLTDKGAAEAANNSSLPWGSHLEGDDEIRALRLAVMQLMSAAKQLSGVGENTQVKRGIAIIQNTRKEIYQILAQD
jgi:DNA-binding PadR family transcriptional regulator